MLVRWIQSLPSLADFLYSRKRTPSSERPSTLPKAIWLIPGCQEGLSALAPPSRPSLRTTGRTPREVWGELTLVFVHRVGPRQADRAPPSTGGLGEGPSQPRGHKLCDPLASDFTSLGPDLLSRVKGGS